MVYRGVLQWVLGLGPGYRPPVPWFETFHDLLLVFEESPALGVAAELGVEAELAVEAGWKQVDNAGV